MHDLKQRAFLVKAGTELPGVYSTVAVLCITALRLSGPLCQRWNILVPMPIVVDVGSGKPQLLITGKGVFVDGVAETQMMIQRRDREARAYQLGFDSGQHVTGEFEIFAMDFVGDVNDERTFSITLMSAGEVEL